VLAVGQRHLSVWRTDSFLLTELPAGAVSLADWLGDRSSEPRWTAERKQRRQVLQEAARLVRSLGEYGYQVSGPGFRRNQSDADFLVVRPGPAGAWLVSLGGVVRLRLHRRGRKALNSALNHFAGFLGWLPLSRAERLRFFLALAGLKRLDPRMKKHARRFFGLSLSVSERQMPVHYENQIAQSGAAVCQGVAT
jgi:hypothetical protein